MVIRFCNCKAATCNPGAPLVTSIKHAKFLTNTPCYQSVLDWKAEADCVQVYTNVRSSKHKARGTNAGSNSHWLQQALWTTTSCHKAQLAQWSAKSIKVYLFFEASHLLLLALACLPCRLSV